ncbi:MAG: DNA-protecting protein DprA [Alphaproteobacteria bacterium]|nr:DNA-protecting protein DprA [Alphaproteobacteria bacterium]
MRDSERFAWLRLARTENIGPVTFANLIRRFGSAQAALDAVPTLAARGGKREFLLPPESEIAREFAGLNKLGGFFLFSCEPEFPQGLGALDPPPPVIAVLGQMHLLKRDMVAIVGARNASALGRKLAWMMARELGEAGLAVVSGLARGIDAAAHEAALETGTVAVVAGGIDIVYPPENQALYDAIRERGVMVSEMRLSESPQARHFPRRNRLISGLARGVIVVEAAERSGSLITAHYAVEQGREIFAVPGSPLDPRAKGCNRLLREGATLTEGAVDVLATLSPILGRSFREPESEGAPSAPPENWEAEADKVRKRVEEALGPAPVAVDELIRQIGAPPGAVLTVLLELELAGRCARHPGNRVSWT